MHKNRIAMVVSLVLSTGVYGAEAAGPEERELGHVKTLNGHGKAVHAVAWSSDGQCLASGSWDKKIRIWDSQTGKELRTLNGHGKAVNSVAWSPDGKHLVSGSWDNTVRIWDPQTGKELRTLNGHGDVVNSVAWSPDGQQLASGSCDNTVRVWDSKPSFSGIYWALKWWDGSSLVLAGQEMTVNSVAWSPDGKHLASGSSDNTVRIWDLQTGKELQILNGHGDVVNSVAWSPDGKHLASGSSDNTVRVWDPKPSFSGIYRALKWWDGSSLVLTGHKAVTSVAWSPDGKHLASGSWDKTVRIWDPQTGEVIRTLIGHKAVTSVAWSSDGQQLASGSSDNTVRIWGQVSRSREMDCAQEQSPQVAKDQEKALVQESVRLQALKEEHMRMREQEKQRRKEFVTAELQRFKNELECMKERVQEQVRERREKEEQLRQWREERKQVASLQGDLDRVRSETQKAVKGVLERERLLQERAHLVGALEKARLEKQKADQDKAKLQGELEQKRSPQNEAPLQPCAASAAEQIEEDEPSIFSANSPSSSIPVVVNHKTIINEIYCCKCTNWVIKLMCCFGCCKNLRKSCNKCNPLKVSVC